MVILETARLIMRDHEPGDLEAYCTMESDAVYRGHQPVHPRDALERSFREVALRPRAPGEFRLAATVLKETGAYVGRTGLYPFRDDARGLVPGEAFLAYYIARPYWGRGIATEAAKAWVEYGFRTLTLKRIEAGIAARNVASLRVAEKAGFSWLRSGGKPEWPWHDYEIHAPQADP
ncbi:MAG TPA: GNAT family N-acetyltransferase [Gemmatimonadaceae bacterium]